LLVGSLGVAASRSVTSLLIWRVVQAFGCASAFSVGAGVIGDLWTLEERGTAMGIFSGVRPAFLRREDINADCVQAILVGPAISPFFGGAAAHYASWRVSQLVLAVLAGLACILMYALLPETAHPGTRGADVRFGVDGKWRWVWLNPCQSLALLRAPNLLLVVCESLSSTGVKLTM
jgi:MFS family permease